MSRNFLDYTDATGIEPNDRAASDFNGALRDLADAAKVAGYRLVDLDKPCPACGGLPGTTAGCEPCQALWAATS